MILSIELTLNRFALRRMEANKFQFLCFRISMWKNKCEHTGEFIISWVRQQNEKI